MYLALTAALAQLGPTPADVAITLRRLGYDGHPGDCDGCPVAQYLAVRLPEHEALLVTKDRVTVYTVSDSQRVIETSAPIPLPVIEFIRGFDLGYYPQLVARKETA